MKKCEIIFRGERADNEEWVFGDLLQVKRNSKLISASIMEQSPVAENFAVIPETVGRYTGEIDKNKKMIFEGDICRFTDYKKSFPYTFIGVIKYYKNIKAVFVSGNYCTDLSEWESEDFEVIGNIHDNPELIGDDTA